jgi:penicillin-binding protein 1A
MKSIHQDLPVKQFVKPDTGLITRRVSARTGELLTDYSDGGYVDEIFLAGTEPDRLGTRLSYEDERDRKLEDRLRDRLALSEYVPPMGRPDLSPLDETATEDGSPQARGTGDDTGDGSESSADQGDQGTNPLLD